MNDLFSVLCENLFIIAGPCVIEDESMVLRLAEKISGLCRKRNLPYVFKASFDKANRTSVDAFRGPGMEAGLRILEKVKKQVGVPVITDIHESAQAPPVAEVVDILQIPAFLCRQTDLLVAAGRTGKIVNIKKAQYLSARDMIYPLEKVKVTGNQSVILTERGTKHGYGDLVVDFRNIVDMKGFGYPVVMDVTHSTQKPGGLGGKSGGNRKYAPYLAAAAAAVGVNGFFFEVHETPDSALCDGPNMLAVQDFGRILEHICAIPPVSELP